MKCHGCGVEKDPAVKEKYPYPDEDSITDDPISPFFDLDCDPISPGDTSCPLPKPKWKKVTVCHECFHKLQPDMWISQRCWRSIDPTTEFNDLPDLYPETGE